MLSTNEARTTQTVIPYVHLLVVQVRDSHATRGKDQRANGSHEKVEGHQHVIVGRQHGWGLQQDECSRCEDVDWCGADLWDFAQECLNHWTWQLAVNKLLIRRKGGLNY